MLCNRFLLSVILVLSIPKLAFSLTSDENIGIYTQFAAREHGYEIGKIGYKWYPKQKVAFMQFSEKYQSPTDPRKLFNWMVEQSILNSSEISDKKTLRWIKEGVSENMKDPTSVMIKNVRLMNGPRGKFYCGEVNGKNSYGGYAGYTYFRSLTVGLKGVVEPTYLVDADDKKYAFYTCLTAFPKK